VLRAGGIQDQYMDNLGAELELLKYVVTLDAAEGLASCSINVAHKEFDEALQVAWTLYRDALKLLVKKQKKKVEEEKEPDPATAAELESLTQQLAVANVNCTRIHYKNAYSADGVAPDEAVKVAEVGEGKKTAPGV
jgi:hypothetical protein